MADFSLPPWLVPQKGWYTDALVKGVQAGSMIAQNMLRAKAMYAEMQESQQRMALESQRITAQNEAQSLQNLERKTKMANDLADMETMAAWMPRFQSTLGDDILKLELPVMHDAGNTMKVADMYMTKRKAIGDTAIAQAIAQSSANGFELDSPETLSNVASIGTKFPEAVGGTAWNNFMQRAENSRKATALKELADNAGYVPPDPETDAPGYFMDAHGRIRFAPDKKEPPKWVPKSGDVPAHFIVGGDRVQFPRGTGMSDEGVLGQVMTVGDKTFVRTSQGQIRYMPSMSPEQKLQYQAAMKEFNSRALLGRVRDKDGKWSSDLYNTQLKAINDKFFPEKPATTTPTPAAAGGLTIPDAVKFQSSSGGIRLRSKADPTKEFIYKGRKEDVPLDEFEILP